MNGCIDRINNQNGSVILIAMLLLVVLTVIGITSTSTTVVENRIAVNDQLQKMAFFHADSGVYVTPKLIRAALREGSPISETDLGNMNSPVSYLDGDAAGDTTGQDLYSQLLGYNAYDGGPADIEYPFNGNRVRADVERLSAQHVVGGGVEFASGAEGMGTAGAGLVNYGLFSVGTGPRNNSTNVSAIYRYVLGVGGGL